MSQFEQWEYVNLLAGAGKFQVKGGLFARDVNGNRIGLHVYHGNDKAALSGTVQGIAKFSPNSDNIEKFEFTGKIGQNGSDVWVDLPKECYYYPGPMAVAIRLVDGDNRTVLATFSGHVNDITDGTPTVPPQSLPDNLEDFIAELEGMKTIVETAAAKVDSMPKIQYGITSSERNGIVNVTFDTAFDTAPIVVLSFERPRSTAMIGGQLTEVTSTGFKGVALAHAGSTLSGVYNATVHWIAIGA